MIRKMLVFLALTGGAAWGGGETNSPQPTAHSDIMTNTVDIVRRDRGPNAITATQTVALAEIAGMNKWEDRGVDSLFRSLLSHGYVTNGTTLAQATAILGPPTDHKPKYVNWYFKRRWHVFPCLSATLTNDCLQDVKIILR
jgi:hypothetical protein